LKPTLPFLVCAVVFSASPAWPDSPADPTQEILALERQAMDGFLKGDPDPQLAIADPEITCFHEVFDKRIEGLAALKEAYAPYRGVPLFESYEILNPKVQVAGDVAILTYRLAQHNAAATNYWNGTLVYRKRAEGWRLIHSHWSRAKQP
jgi:ketosteroid isomerase-like protein